MTVRTIDDYLDELLFELRAREPGLVRRVMREAEDHLRECASLRAVEGVTTSASESAAIEAFGPPRQFAQGFPRWRRPIDGKALARQGMLALGLVMVTIGLNGAVLFGLSQWVDDNFVVREGSAVIELPATGPCGYLEDSPQPGAWCPREAFHDLEAQALRSHIRSEVTWQLAVGAVGVALVATGLGIKRSMDFRQQVPARGLRIAAITGLGLFALFFLYMGYSWGQTQGKQGEGWFYAWGIAAAMTFAAISTWLATVSWRMPLSGRHLAG
jgi:hypothetical protein